MIRIQKGQTQRVLIASVINPGQSTQGYRPEASAGALRAARLIDLTPHHIKDCSQAVLIRVGIKALQSHVFLAVKLRRKTDVSLKCATHDLGAAEACPDGDRFESLIRTFQIPARGFNSHVLHEVSRRHPGLPEKYTGEVTRPHSDSSGHRFHRQIARQVFGDPNQQFANGLAIRSLRVQQRTELCRAGYLAANTHGRREF